MLNKIPFLQKKDDSASTDSKRLSKDESVNYLVKNNLLAKAINVDNWKSSPFYNQVMVDAWVDAHKKGLPSFDYNKDKYKTSNGQKI